MSDPAPLDDAATPAVRPDLATAAIDGELVVYDPRTAKVHQLDPLGAVIWQLLDGTATVAELIVDLAEGFGVDQARVRADVAALLQMLEENALLDGGELPPALPEPAERAGPEYLVDPPGP